MTAKESVNRRRRRRKGWSEREGWQLFNGPKMERKESDGFYRNKILKGGDDGRRGRWFVVRERQQGWVWACG